MKHMHHRWLVWLALLCLSACTSAPPAPDWQMNAHASAQRAVQAWLNGEDRVADKEWAQARAEVARTGRADYAVRLELLRCAAQAAALQFAPCTAFEALRPDASAADIAYADYLAGRLDAGLIPLLPETQRAAAVQADQLGTIVAPLSRLVAAAAALQAGRATPDTLVWATDTASAEGWRRPLLAWLRLRQQRAQEAGEPALAEQLGRRIALVQGGGARVGFGHR